MNTKGGVLTLSTFTIHDAAKTINRHFSALSLKLSEKEKAELLEKCAKKLCEEILETGLVAQFGDRKKVVDESADVLLRLLILLAVRSIPLEHAEAALKQVVDSYLKKNSLDTSAGSS